jgi:hypothetical protein
MKDSPEKISPLRRRMIEDKLFLESPACDCACECWRFAGTPQDTRSPPTRRRFPTAFPQDQRVDTNLVSLRVLRLGREVERAMGIEPTGKVLPEL